MGTNGSADGRNDYLQIREVSRVYGGGGGVRSVSVDVGRGEMLVLLGPSGCGKTTLLRTIAGLTEVDSGTVSVGGDDITCTPTHRRNVGMVFQTWALFPHMTVSKNVGYGLRMQGVAKAEIDERVIEALAMVRMDQFADRKPKQLSGGQQQRVALARAIVTRPRVLLLDEPLSSLDYRIRVSLRSELRRLQRSLGVTGVYVTHDYSEALALGDRIAVMRDGVVVELGTPREIFVRPRHRYTAEFLNVGNLLQCHQVDASGDSVRVEVLGQLISLRREGDAVGPVEWLCLPHRAARIGGPGHLLTGRLSEVEYETGGAVCTVVLDGSGVEIVCHQELDADTTLEVGSSVQVSLDLSEAFAVHDEPAARTVVREQMTVEEIRG
jgi:ABC-type Fe3+/spermidine/putrescine transport system ATPase subunit